MNKANENKTREEWMKWLKYFKNHRYELSKEECLALRDDIKKYPSVAEEFFFRTLDPMNKGFAHKIYESYNVVVDFRDIATCIYLAMYDGGTWTRWDTYRADCGIFAWISYCATQAVFTELEELHYIETSFDLTAKNTSLTLKSMRDKDELMMVLDLVEVPQMHELLTRIYLLRMSDEQIMQHMGMSEELFKKTRKVAETMLKECLISEGQMLVERADGKTVNLVSETLSDLSGKIKTSTSDEAMLAADKMFSDDDEFDELKEALEQFYPGMPWMEQWVNFVLDRAAELNWNEEDETVFYERFYHHTDPVSLAKRLGRARTWIDNKFSRENKALVAYIKKWWSIYCR